jgi:hypothetical protein
MFQLYITTIENVWPYIKIKQGEFYLFIEQLLSVKKKKYNILSTL